MTNLTGGQVAARALKAYGVEYVAGIPGHGIWSLTDAFLDDESRIPFLHVFHVPGRKKREIESIATNDTRT